ncbi:MAG: VanZ family protein [Bacteroidota bacterium]
MTRVQLLAFMFFGLIFTIFIAATMGWTSALLAKVPYGDKLMHFFLIGGFAFFMNLLLRNRKILVGKWVILLGSTLVFALMTVEEFSQMFVTTRTFDLVDLACNYAGIFFIGRLSKKVEVEKF